MRSSISRLLAVAAGLLLAGLASGPLAHAASAADARGASARAVAAGVASRDVEALLAAARAHGYQAAVPGFLDALADARRRGLPEGSLVAKALEGMAKGAAPEAIDRALGVWAESLATATALSRDVEKAGVSFAASRDRRDFVEAAAALARRGVPPATVRGLAGSRVDGRAFTGAVELMETLLSLGVPVSAAPTLPAAALARGYDHGRMHALGRAVASAVHSGRTPAEVVDAARRGVVAGLDPAASVGGAATGPGGAAGGGAGGAGAVGGGGAGGVGGAGGGGAGGVGGAGGGGAGGAGAGAGGAGGVGGAGAGGAGGAAGGGAGGGGAR